MCYMSCPSQSSRFRFLIMLGKEYNACSSALCNFLHSPVISSLLAPNIFLSTLFSYILNLCSSLNARDPVSEPYNTTSNLIVLYVLTFSFLESRRTIKFSQVILICICHFHSAFNFFANVVCICYHYSKIWSLTLREEHRLRVFENKVL